MSAATRRERERSERRLAILQAAGRLLSTRPYDQVRMEDIAEAAEVAKGTLYLHFADKDDLVAVLGQDLLGRLGADLDTVLAEVRRGSIEPLEGLAQALRVWGRAYFAQPGIFRLLVLDRPLLLAAFTAGRDGHGPAVLGAVETLVEWAQRSGQISDETQPAVVSHALWALFVGGLLLEGRGEISPQDLEASSLHVLQALVRGLCPPVPS